MFVDSNQFSSIVVHDEWQHNDEHDDRMANDELRRKSDMSLATNAPCLFSTFASLSNYDQWLQLRCMAIPKPNTMHASCRKRQGAKLPPPPTAEKCMQVHLGVPSFASLFAVNSDIRQHTSSLSPPARLPHRTFLNFQEVPSGRRRSRLCGWMRCRPPCCVKKSE